MVLLGRRLLPRERLDECGEVLRQADDDLLSTYHLCDRLFRARIPAGSALIDCRLGDSTLRENYGINVVAVERNGEKVLAPMPDFVFQQGGMRCCWRDVWMSFACVMLSLI